MGNNGKDGPHFGCIEIATRTMSIIVNLFWISATHGRPEEGGGKMSRSFTVTQMRVLCRSVVSSQTADSNLSRKLNPLCRDGKKGMKILLSQQLASLAFCVKATEGITISQPRTNLIGRLCKSDRC